MSDAIRPEFYATVNAKLDKMIESFYEVSPGARYLATSSSIDKKLFVRHTIETILRIRLARVADSKVIQHFAKSDPFAAQKWSKYTEEEMLHDRLFLKDLKNLGISEEQVYGSDPLLATKLLQGYLYYTIEHEGPRGLLCKSYFVEYTTKKTQAMWNGNVKRALGEQAVKGAEAHLNYDLAEDHSTDVWNVLMAVVDSAADEARVLYHLDVYYGLFLAYFSELAAAAKVDLGTPAQDAGSTAVWGAQRAAQLGADPRRQA
jgi:hypothetical protein